MNILTTRLSVEKLLQVLLSQLKTIGTTKYKGNYTTINYYESCDLNYKNIQK